MFSIFIIYHPKCHPNIIDIHGTQRLSIDTDVIESAILTSVGEFTQNLEILALTSQYIAD